MLSFSSKCDVMNYKLITPQYQLDRLKLRISAHAAYKRALKLNMTKMFMDFVKSRVVDFRQNIILSIFGETGTGKSYVGWRLGEYVQWLVMTYLNINLEFDERSVHLDLASQLANLKYAKPFSVNITDEQTDFYGTGSLYVVSSMENIEATCRKVPLNFICCSPRVRTHFHNYVLETFMVEWPKQRKVVGEEGYIPHGRTYCFVYSPESKKYIIPMGYIIINHPTKLDALIRYEKKKDNYMEKIITGESISVEEIRQEHISEFFKHEMYTSNPNLFLGRSGRPVKSKIKILLNKVIPGGAPNTFRNEIATEIQMIIESKTTN